MKGRGFIWVWLIGLFTWTGCKEGSFLERHFDNFTAHYNGYYNANRTFRTAIENIERQDNPIDLDRYLPVFTLPESRQSQQFEQVVEKCADLLRNHPRSKWVDDALILIGKAWFYQSNYVGAEQKFREVIDVGGPLADEARFWLARTLVAGRSSQALLDAIDLVQETLQREDLSERWAPRLHLVMGDLYVQQQEWENAVIELEEGLKNPPDNDEAARAQFLLGQVYETMEAYEEAAEAYRRVQRYNPLYELSYAALESEARMQGLYVDPDRGLELLGKMINDDKHFSYLDRLDLLRGKVLLEKGDGDASLAIYDEMLYPDDRTRVTRLRGEVHYALGELYRDFYTDYFIAAAHFDTAASALRAPRVTGEAFTPHALTDFRDQADIFRKYTEVAGRVADMDSLLYLGTLDDAAFDSVVAVIAEELAAREAARQAELERRRAESGFRNTGGGAATAPKPPGAPGGAQAGSAFGFLNHKDPTRIEDGRTRFREKWGDRPLVPNWRREEAIGGALEEEPAQTDSTNTTDTPGRNVASAPGMNLDDVPRDSLSRAQMLTERAEARYELANVFFLSMGLPDSAAFWYRRVIEEDSAQTVAQRAFYALAEINLALKDTLSSRRIYREILDQYPESDFAIRARERLELPPVEKAPDSLQLAQLAYNDAFDTWQRGVYKSAAERMLLTAAEYPHTDVAPQAMLATTMIYKEWARRDSLDLFGIIPVREDLFPDTLHQQALARILKDTTAIHKLPDSLLTDASPVPIEIDSTATTGTDATSVQTPETAHAEQQSTENPVDVPPISKAVDEQPVQNRQVTEEADKQPAQNDPVTDEEASAPSTKPAPEPDDEVPQLPQPNTQVSTEPDDERPQLPESNPQVNAEPDDEMPQKPGEVPEQPATGKVDDTPIANQTREPDSETPNPTRPNSVQPSPEAQVKPQNADDATVAPNRDAQPADSLISSANATDSTLVVSDSTALATQTPQLNPPQAAATPTVPPEPEPPAEPFYYIKEIIPHPLRLETLYGSIEQHFADTDFARRARVLKQALDDFRPKPPQDTTTALPDSTLPADSLQVLPDSMMIARNDSLGAWPDSTANPTTGPVDTTVTQNRIPATNRPSLAEEIGDTRPQEPERPAIDISPEVLADTSNVYETVEVMPRLLGGLRALRSQMTYPEAARAAGIEGRVQVSFIINELGDVVFPVVKQPLGGGCDEEAIRVIQLAKFEPGEQNDQPVKVRRSFTLQCTDTNP